MGSSPRGEVLVSKISHLCPTKYRATRCRGCFHRVWLAADTSVDPWSCRPPDVLPCLFGPHFEVFILRLARRSNDRCLGCSIAVVIRGDLTMVFKFREPSASPLQRHFPTVLNITAQERGTPAVPVKLSIPIEFSIGSYRLTKTKYRI